MKLSGSETGQPRLPPISFEMLTLALPAEIDRFKWEVHFSNYIICPDLFWSDVQDQANILEILTREIKLGPTGQTLLSTLMEKTQIWRRWIALQKAISLAATTEWATTGKQVIFAVGRSGLADLQQSMKSRGAVILHAGTPPEKALKIGKRFKESSRCNLLLCEIEAARVHPIDLTSASSAVFLESDWTPDANMAAVMRLYNAKQRKPVKIWFASLDHDPDKRLQLTMKNVTRNGLLSHLAEFVDSADLSVASHETEC